MSSKRQKGMSSHSQQSSGWWEDINSGSIGNQSSNLVQKSTRQRGRVQKNAKKRQNNPDPFLLDKNPEKAREQFDANNPPLVSLEQKSPLIWTTGTLILYIIVFICEIVQEGGIASTSRNPLIGPSDDTMIIMGAKYGPPIIAGEWWRFITALFLHSGVIHLVLTVALKFCTTDVERDSGYWRAVVVYLASGGFGFILSCLFVPEMVSTGSTGAVFGYIGLLLCDLLSTWRGVEKRTCKLIKYIVCIVITIIVGLTPYIDNFAHIGGFIMGFCAAIMLLPNMTFGLGETTCYGIISFLAFPVMSVIFCVCLVLIFRSIDPAVSWCQWCYAIDCVNISGWCPTLGEESQTTQYLL